MTPTSPHIDLLTSSITFLTYRFIVIVRCEFFEVDSDPVFILVGRVASTAVIIGYLELDQV